MTKRQNYFYRQNSSNVPQLPPRNPQSTTKSIKPPALPSKKPLINSNGNNSIKLDSNVNYKTQLFDVSFLVKIKLN